MYTTSEDYAAYTGESAPSDYARQELYATTLFKSLYPNFPSETTFATLDSDEQELIEYAIFEQINEGIDYSGTVGSTTSSFSVGSFSISDGASSQLGDKISGIAVAFLAQCGCTYKGVGTC